MNLTTAQKIRIYFSGIAVLVIIIGLSLNYQAWLKAKDILVLNQLKSLGSGLERFREDFWRYPEASDVNLDQFLLLTENGFARGTRLYYQGEILDDARARYASDGENYQISFRLKSKWPGTSLGGKKCLLTTGQELHCS